MGRLSSYPHVSTLAGTELVPVVVTPGVAGGNAYITADEQALSTPFTSRYARGCYSVPTLNTTANLVAQTAAAGEVAMFTQAHTALASRLYEISVTIGLVTKNTNTGNVTVRVKIGATTYGTWQLSITAGLATSVNFTSLPTTLPAGANTITVTVQTNTDTVTASNTGTSGVIVVKDIGPG